MLTVEQALREARERAPYALELSERIRAEEGRVRQAGARPNPEVDVQVENFAGSRPLSGTRAAETTGSFALPVELGGKRQARIGAAKATLGLTEAETDAALLDLDLAVRNAHTEAAKAEAAKRLATSELEIARALEDTVGKLVSAGREPPLRQVTAATERAQAEANATLAAAERIAAREALAALIGRSAADFEVPPLATDRLADRPPGAMTPADADLRSADLQLEAAQQRLRLARSERAPDVRLSVGVRRLAAEDATAMVAGVAIPFPLFNRNGGNIAAAAAEARGAEAQRQRRVRDAQARLAAADARARAAVERLATYERTVVPGAEEALRIARLGYAAGRFPYVDLLQAQRGLAAARRDRLAAASDAAFALAERDRAAGLYVFGGRQ
jgi:cobalt-zinc-cadmium efflux system outer membrane protein